MQCYTMILSVRNTREKRTVMMMMLMIMMLGYPTRRNIASPPDSPFDKPGFIQSPAAVMLAMRLYPNRW
jgi:hypothetical protein